MSDDQEANGVEVRLDGAVLHIVLSREEARNALSVDMIETMTDAVESAGKNDDTRAIVISSAGNDFCSGADLIAGNPGGRRPRVGSLQRRLPTQAHRLIPALLNTQTPVVCAVRGWCCGIGFHIAVASDFCVATNTAKFWEPFVARGFTADSAGSWLLPRLVGPARARELLILGRQLSGEEAASWGLIHQSVPDDQFEDTVADITEQLAAGPTVAIGLTKWLMHVGSSLDVNRHLVNEALALELSSRTSDFREGLESFRDHRTPHFEGR